MRGSQLNTSTRKCHDSHRRGVAKKKTDLLTTIQFVLLTFCNAILIAGMRFAIECYRELNDRMEQNDVVLNGKMERTARPSATARSVSTLCLQNSRTRCGTEPH
jgi:hypothetical protein